MANPLQPKVIKTLEQDYKAYVIKVVSASKSGTGDIVCCIRSRPWHTDVGLFYMFEVKYKNDQPSELQKEKINKCIAAGGRAYFIRSIEQLEDILDNNRDPIKYKLKNSMVL